MAVYKRATETSELKQILQLQKKNRKSALSFEEIEIEGFITVSHSFELLQRMNDTCSQIIAKKSGQVAGYALCMT